MAPIKVIKVTPQTKPQPATVPAHGGGAPQAPTRAPNLRPPTTGIGGEQPKTAPTFNQNPTLKPNPPDNGSVNVISDQRQPAPRGPAPAMGVPGGQQQQQGR